MSIPPDFRDYEHDPVLSDERLTPDDTDEPEAWGRARTRLELAQDLGHRAQTTDVEGFGGGKLIQAEMGIGVDTAMTREEAMETREPPSRILQYSDLFKQGTPLRMDRPQTPEKYGARTKAALRAATGKSRFQGQGDFGTAAKWVGRQSPGSLEENLQEAKDNPRYAHHEETEHDLWRDLMEETPDRTAGSRESFDSLLSPRGSRTLNRDWPGSVDPKTPDLPPPPPSSGRGRPRKQL